MYNDKIDINSSDKLSNENEREIIKNESQK